jgi:tRNA 2-selenouridine synthase
MIETLEDLTPQARGRFDEIIDVRSPGEFALDRLPGAINLPVLDDAERARVGTIYVQESRPRARRIGAALVARNIAAHLEGPLADRPGAWRPLVYCWRGGQRSHAMATVLDQVGWRVSVVAGGYRTWRRRVSAALYDASPDLDLILLDGDTGAGKTDILRALAMRGHQVLDLENLAGHRGSLFGAIPGSPQPSQKLFETRLMAALEGIDQTRPVVVEAESSKIGERLVPPMLWQAMQRAPRIEIAAPRAARAAYVGRLYTEAVADLDALAQLLARLPGRHGAKLRAAWLEMARTEGPAALAEALMEAHYDPAYARSRRGAMGEPLARICLADPAQPDSAVEAVEGIIARRADAGPQLAANR